jgi:CRISPR-associated protein Cas1
MVEKEYLRLLVTRDDQVICRVPFQNVTQVVLSGRVGLTTPAMHALLMAHVPVFLVQRGGKLTGRLLPETSPNLPLRLAQYRKCEDKTFGLEVARSIVRAKLRNQRVLAMRILRRRPMANAAPLAVMRAAEEHSALATDLEELRGLEGTGARAYFAVYRQAFGPGWASAGRSRRPPRDALNALLSLGYTMLGHAVLAAIEVVGLDPYLGYYHMQKYGRPSLALDLMEEFRSPFVDSLVMTLTNKRMLDASDFEAGDAGGIYLRDGGLRTFLREFGDRLEGTVMLPGTGRALSYRKVFEVQARRLADAVQGRVPRYEPFHAR